MNSEQLAAEVEETIRFCQEGILGVGDEQYSRVIDGQPMQKFEIMTLADFLQYAREEARDLVNYGVMLDIKLRRLQDEVRGRLHEEVAPPIEHCDKHNSGFWRGNSCLLCNAENDPEGKLRV